MSSPCAPSLEDDTKMRHATSRLASCRRSIKSWKLAGAQRCLQAAAECAQQEAMQGSGTLMLLQQVRGSARFAEVLPESSRSC